MFCVVRRRWIWTERWRQPTTAWKIWNRMWNTNSASRRRTASERANRSSQARSNTVSLHVGVILAKFSLRFFFRRSGQTVAETYTRTSFVTVFIETQQQNKQMKNYSYLAIGRQYINRKTRLATFTFSFSHLWRRRRGAMPTSRSRSRKSYGTRHFSF